MKSKIISIAKHYLQIPTAPFREDYVRNFIKSFCNERAIPYSQDHYGNIIVSYGKPAKNIKKNNLSFIAHMDHPGFIAEKNSRDNKCTALFYGGWDPTEFKAAPVRFFSKNKESISAKAIKWEKALKEKAWRAHLFVNNPVKKGDIGMWDFSPYEIRKNRLYSRSCDDGIGCILLLTLLDFFSTNNDQTPFSVIFSSAEEPGLHGAKYICINKLLPQSHILISVETSRELPVAKIGDGVIIRVGDARSIFTPAITDAMVNIAKQIKVNDNSFQFQRKLMDGGQCEATVFSSFGYNTGALSIPLGNYHNRNFTKKTTEPEYVSIQDMTNAFILIREITMQIKSFSILKRSPPSFKESRGTLGQIFYS